MKNCFLFLFAALLLAGCVTNVNPDSYSVGAVGQVNRTIAGVIVSARAVEISGTTGVGGATGALAGGVAGSAIGSGGRAHALGAIGGAVAGALVGAAIEKGVTNQAGIEYVVQTENDNLITLVQGAEPVYQIGDHVMVLYGNRSRIVADPRFRK